MRVLLTDGSHKNTLAIIRYLGKKHEIYILHNKKSAPAYSKYCKELIICPKITDKESYYNFVINFIKNRSFDILIPVGINAVEIFSMHLEEIRKFIKIEILEYEKLKCAFNKDETFQLAEKLNIPCPKTIYPKTIEEAISFSKRLVYPLIIKSPNEVLMRFPTIYVNNQDEYLKELKLLVNKYPEEIRKSFPIVQEKISGEGYGFFSVYNNGECQAFCMHKRIRENPITGGASTSAITVIDEELKNISIKILDFLKWHGQVMIEYKKDITDGKFKLIEINPKFWGSLELCLSAGVNFPELLCRIAQGEEIQCSDNYKIGLQFQWIVSSNGELYRLLQKKSDWKYVLADFFKKNTKSDIWISDIKPTLIEILYLLIFLKNNLFK